MNHNNLTKSKIKHVIVTYETYERLCQNGRLGDTFNDVIARLLDDNSKV